MAGHGTICPRCKHGRLYRHQRKTWMRRIPRSKYFECGNCDARFLSIFGRIMKLPLTRLREAPGVLQTDLSCSTQSPGQERAHWFGKIYKYLTPVKISLVILALGSFIIYQGLGGKEMQQIYRRSLQFLPKASTPQDGPIISEPENLPEGELVRNRTNLPKPEEKKEPPSVLPDEGKSAAAHIFAKVAPSPEPESLAIFTQPSQIQIKRGESLARIIAQHYPKNQQIGLVAIMLANPEISNNYLIYAGQVLKLPQLDLTDKIIELQDNSYYSLYGRYYLDDDFKKHKLWLNKKKVKYFVKNNKDLKGKTVHLIILGGYEKKEDLKETLQSIKNNSK